MISQMMPLLYVAIAFLMFLFFRIPRDYAKANKRSYRLLFGNPGIGNTVAFVGLLLSLISLIVMPVASFYWINRYHIEGKTLSYYCIDMPMEKDMPFSSFIVFCLLVLIIMLNVDSHIFRFSRIWNIVGIMSAVGSIVCTFVIRGMIQNTLGIKKSAQHWNGQNIALMNTEGEQWGYYYLLIVGIVLIIIAIVEALNNKNAFSKDNVMSGIYMDQSFTSGGGYYGQNDYMNYTGYSNEQNP